MRMRATLERAEYYARIIRREGITQEDLAAREGVTGPRVNQVLAFLRLERAILDDLTDLSCTTPVPTMSALAAIGRLPTGRAQVARYRQLCAALEASGNAGAVGSARQRGFRHLLAQAREWQDALNAGKYRSISALGRAERLSSHRVGQLLDLLTLPPDLQARLDAPPESLPPGLTQKEVKRIVSMQDEEAKRMEFLRGWGEGGGAEEERAARVAK